ncbi:tyrosine-type recombinase/integrase [Dysgonomonas termitidis]|uniref:Tyrosine-type recombinase/integrase n=1 Tax=Dysgonomonas termitidis TaxID=1516126 RepID=A0ABV9L0B3_9BACT
MNKNNLSRNQMYDSFVEFRRLTGRKNTYSALCNLFNFINFCNKNYKEEYLSLQMINEWCKKRGTEKASSYNKRIYLIRSFLYYLKTSGYFNIEIPEFPQFLPKEKQDSELQKNIPCWEKDIPYETLGKQPFTKPSRNELYRIYVEYRKASGLKVSKSALKNLTTFANACNRNYKESHLTQHMTDTWCAKRENELPSSRNTRISLICTFLDFLRKRNYIDFENPPYLPNEKTSHRVPHEFTEEELCKFFKACDNIGSKYKIRKFERIRRIVVPVIFRLLYSSGLRTCEARELRRCDVNLETGVVNIVISKTYSEHIIVLHDSMRELLIQYDVAIENIMPGRTIFFPNIHDKPFSNHWLNDNFNQMWYRYNKVYAIPYDFRHGYAIKNMNRWITKEHADCFVSDQFLALSRSMGHDSIVNTLYYYSYVPSFGKILQDFCEESYNNIVQELDYDEEYE